MNDRVQTHMVDIGDGAHYVGLDGLSDLNWVLRYGDPDSVRLVAASVVSCYVSLIGATNARRNQIANAIKAAATRED